jgi:hypothetical protein
MSVIGELSIYSLNILTTNFFHIYWTSGVQNTRNVVNIHRGNGPFVTSPVYVLFLMILLRSEPVLGNGRNAHSRKFIARIPFYVDHAMPFTRQRVATHILAEADEQKDRSSTARQRRSIHTLSTI